MTNTTKFKNMVESNGIKLNFIARSIGISRESLYQKINNQTEFKASEIYAISSLMRLTSRERDEIFFAKVGE